MRTIASGAQENENPKIRPAEALTHVKAKGHGPRGLKQIVDTRTGGPSTCRNRRKQFPGASTRVTAQGNRARGPNRYVKAAGIGTQATQNMERQQEMGPGESPHKPKHEEIRPGAKQIHKNRTRAPEAPKDVKT